MRRYTLNDPGSTVFAAPPYQESDSASIHDRQGAQTPVSRSGSRTDALRRYGTRKIKLVQGSVLSVDYPVPSAIQNAIQSKYRDVEESHDEFKFMRCKYYGVGYETHKLCHLAHTNL
jgi:chitin synthase